MRLKTLGAHLKGQAAFIFNLIKIMLYECGAGAQAILDGWSQKLLAVSIFPSFCLSKEIELFAHYSTPVRIYLTLFE